MAAKSVYLCKYSYFSWEISSRETGLVQQCIYKIGEIVVNSTVVARLNFSTV